MGTTAVLWSLVATWSMPPDRSPTELFPTELARVEHGRGSAIVLPTSGLYRCSHTYDVVLRNDVHEVLPHSLSQLRRAAIHKPKGSFYSFIHRLSCHCRQVPNRSFVRSNANALSFCSRLATQHASAFTFRSIHSVFPFTISDPGEPCRQRALSFSRAQAFGDRINPS